MAYTKVFTANPKMNKLKHLCIFSKYEQIISVLNNI